MRGMNITKVLTPPFRYPDIVTKSGLLRLASALKTGSSLLTGLLDVETKKNLLKSSQLKPFGREPMNL